MNKLCQKLVKCFVFFLFISAISFYRFIHFIRIFRFLFIISFSLLLNLVFKNTSWGFKVFQELFFFKLLFVISVFFFRIFDKLHQIFLSEACNNFYHNIFQKFGIGLITKNFQQYITGEVRLKPKIFFCTSPS